MREVLSKLAQLVIALVVVTFLSFALLQLVPPAGHVERVLVVGDASNPIVAQRQAEVRKQLGLDEPLVVQYVQWLDDFVHGDMGYYYRVTGQDPVWDHIKDALPVSIELLVYSTTLTILFAIPLGVLSAYRQNKPSDKVINGMSFAGISMPNFALGLILAYYVGVRLGWLPPTGYTRPTEDLGGHVRTMVLPTISLAVGQIAVLQRLLRSDMIQTLQEDFVLVAKSKGISDQRVLWRHALRPSSLTLLTVLGFTIGTLIGGAIAVEVVFNLPGMGTLIFQAISQRQYIALQSAVAIIAIGYVLINFAVDAFYRLLDPRIRRG